MIELNHIYNEDCLQTMARMEDESVDMILQDPPYGITACKWDKPINLEIFWSEWKRIIKPHGAIVMTASQPFTSALVMSNSDMFKYEWIWDKALSTGHLNSKIIPLKRHENILIFGIEKLRYNPVMKKRNKQRINKSNGREFHGDGLHTYGKFKSIDATYNERFPTSILEISNANKHNILHPTQKPVALFEYLIRTYTNEGNLVFDGFMGSGTTAVACIKLNRNFIGSEISPDYCTIANKRLEPYLAQGSLV